MRPLALLLSLLPALALADGPKDNIASAVRPIPPPGVQVPKAEADKLDAALKGLRAAIDEAAKAQAKNPMLADLLPDVEIYHKAVDWALRYGEFHKAAEIKSAHEQIAEGLARAAELKVGKHSWTSRKGLVLRAYRSRIDGSVQPYGMVIPESYSGAPSRLDFWCHGRGETLSELAFVEQRSKQVGNIAPANTLVLHPYGRYCCANKFAGEVDLFEALEHAQKFYAIDPNRLVIRGFSMGGAAAWQFAVNHAQRWCAANPGAGFAETPEFLKVFQSEDVSSIPDYQKKLWHWYNATDSALNLFHVPTVAYSGEVDKQKQAADIMEQYLRMENIELTHIIGPQTAHKIHPESLVEIEKRLAAITALGAESTPREVHFSTWFLRYHRMHWLVVDELREHWQRTRVHAKLTDKGVEIRTQNVAALSIDMPAGHCPLSVREKPSITIDGSTLEVLRPKTDRSWSVHLRLKDGVWTQTLEAHAKDSLVKRHGLSGPIDDAFMDRFLMVRPSGKPLNEALGRWCQSEMDRAGREWRRQFRGDAPIKDDKAVSAEDIANSNLVLWGDPQSNAVLARLIKQLPIGWDAKALQVNGRSHDAAMHAPVLIYPNPLNPSRYIVINSSFTYREYDYLNNARQIPKLPDWAVIGLSKAPDAISPGAIVDAGFFNEQWQPKGGH